MERPDMREYFRSRIDWHTMGLFAGMRRTLPSDVWKVTGDVTDREILVTMRDGTEYRWNGGKYASRKRNGCYAPLMPTKA